MPKNKQKDIVEELVNESNKDAAPIITAALKAHKKEQEERQQQLVLRQLRQIDDTIKGSVQDLKIMREDEKRAKNRVKILAEAKEQFIKNADFSEFNKAAISVGIYM